MRIKENAKLLVALLVIGWSISAVTVLFAAGVWWLITMIFGG